jgi:outer membrane scaffolding protein for murein synthesis (MipA/OmpV family)
MRSGRFLPGAILVASATITAATSSRAEIPPFYSLGPRPQKDILAVGAMYFRAPLYAGSDEPKSVMAPSATAILVNGFFADPISGIGWNASTDPRFEFGPRATLGLGREEPAALHGMGKIHNAVNVGGFANYNATNRFQLQSALRYGSGYDRDGALLDAGASYDIFQRDHVAVTVAGSASFANAAYMQSFYGVSGAQSARSGYPEYHPHSGMQWHVLELSVTAPVHPKALAYFALDYGRLDGPAAASPLSRKSDWIAIEMSVDYAF